MCAFLLGTQADPLALLLLYIIYSIEVELIYNGGLISSVRQSDAVIPIVLFHYDLSQDIEYSSLRCTAGLCSLSIPFIIKTATINVAHLPRSQQFGQVETDWISAPS